MSLQRINQSILTEVEEMVLSGWIHLRDKILKIFLMEKIRVFLMEDCYDTPSVIIKRMKCLLL